MTGGELVFADESRCPFFTEPVQCRDYIKGSEENEKTSEWLKQIGLQLPSRTPNAGSIGSITDDGDSVNISGKTLEELFGEDSASERKVQYQLLFRKQRC